nr:lysozyme [uncultured Cohaesibacter sp.]
MSKRAKAALASGMGLVALTATYLVQPWEGTKNLAYWDRFGKVWTVCTGETKGVKKGDRYTDKECSEMLYKTLEKDYHKPLQRCIEGFDDLPLGLQASMLDLAYNVGHFRVCKSTGAKYARSGSFEKACYAFTAYNRSGGQVLKGLKLRREYGDAKRIGELELCLEGLK